MIRITTIIVVLGLLFGGSSAAVVGAQDSLPGEALYSIKTAIEDVQMLFTFDEDERLAKALDLVNTRYIEASIKEQDGSNWTDDALAIYAQRLEKNLNEALLVAAAADDPQDTLTSITDQVTDLAVAIQKRPQDQVSMKERGDGLMVVCMWREAYEQLIAGMEDPIPFTEVDPDCNEETQINMDLLVVAVYDAILESDAVDGGNGSSSQQSPGGSDPLGAAPENPFSPGVTDDQTGASTYPLKNEPNYLYYKGADGDDGYGPGLPGGSGYGNQDTREGSSTPQKENETAP
jgi:hypothetical protein